MLGLQWTFSLRLAGHFTGTRLLTCQWRAVCCCNAGKHSASSAETAASSYAAGVFSVLSDGRGCAARIPPNRGADFYALLRQFRPTVLSLGGGPQATTIELAIFQALGYLATIRRAACWH